MELHQLYHFMKVVEAGSISEGSRLLHMSQPPLSFQMKQLEQELGVRLFERGHKRIELTEAGRVLYNRGQVLLDLERGVSREVRSAGKRSLLHIGMIPTTEPVLLPYLRELAQSDPMLRFEIYDGCSFELLDLLRRNIIEIAMLRSLINAEGFDSITVRRDPMILVWNDALLPQTFTSPVVSMLSGLPLIICRRYHDRVYKTFELRGCTCDILCECDDVRTAVQWASVGIGIGLLPASIAPLCTGLNISPVSEPKFETDILLVKRSSVHLSPHAAALWESVASSCTQPC